MAERAKIFKNGGSQAVRLPKSCRFPEGQREVLVSRVGKNVILAARIVAQARGGEILVSSLVKELTHSSGDIHFDIGRETALKGLSGTYTVHPVQWAAPVTGSSP